MARKNDDGLRGAVRASQIRVLKAAFEAGYNAAPVSVAVDIRDRAWREWVKSMALDFESEPK